MADPIFHEGPHRVVKRLNDLHRALLQCDPPDDLPTWTMKTAATLLPVSAGSLWRSDRPGIPEALRLEAALGPVGRRAFPRRLKLAGSISLTAIHERRPEVVANWDVMPDSIEKSMARQRQLTSFLCLPVNADAADPVGVLHFYTSMRHEFSPPEIETAEALAMLMAHLWHRDEWKAETHRLKEELKTRKRVDRAKEILMDRRAMSSEAAYRWLQKRSMDTRRSMREVADIIIHAELSGRYSSIPHALDFTNKLPRK